jgi:hypothetical protein
MDIGEEARQMSAREQMLDLQDRVSRSIIGQEHVVEQLLLALLANGNVLMEGLPGLAKTLDPRSTHSGGSGGGRTGSNPLGQSVSDPDATNNLRPGKPE